MQSLFCYSFILQIIFCSRSLKRPKIKKNNKCRVQIESSDKMKWARYSKQRPRAHIGTIVIEWSFSMKQCAKCLSRCLYCCYFVLFFFPFDFKWFLAICKRSVRKRISVRSLASQPLHSVHLAKYSNNFWRKMKTGTFQVNMAKTNGAITIARAYT